MRRCPLLIKISLDVEKNPQFFFFFLVVGVGLEGTAMVEPWLLSSCQPRAPGKFLPMLLKLRAVQFPSQNDIKVCGFRPHFRHT